MLDGTTVACGQCSPVFSQSCATTVACGQCSPSGLWIMLTCLQSVLYSYSGLWTMLTCLQSVLCSHSGLWTMLTCLQSVLCSYSGLWTMLTCLQSVLYSYSSPLHPQSMLHKNLLLQVHSGGTVSLFLPHGNSSIHHAHEKCCKQLDPLTNFPDNAPYIYGFAFKS